MTLYLTRHGETDANAAGLVQGRGMDPDLNAVGRAQAEALARRLAAVPLAAVYASTQRRSQQTAEPALAGHPGARLVVRSGLDEMDWGVHEGRGYTPESSDPATFAAYEALNRAWAAGQSDVHVEGWTIGTPDAVFTMTEPFQVPADGTIPYQYLEMYSDVAMVGW